MSEEPSWQSRFPGAEVVVEGEGGGVWAAAGEGAYWLITDESAIAEHGPRLERYTDRADWAGAVGRRRRHAFLGRALTVVRPALDDVARHLQHLHQTRAAEGPAVIEADLDKALRAALVSQGRSEGDLEVHAGQRTVKLDDFAGVGGVDVAFTLRGHEALIEDKYSSDPADNAKLPNCAWDISKLALCLHDGLATGAFLVAGVPTVQWSAQLWHAEITDELFARRRWQADELRKVFEWWYRFFEGAVKCRQERCPAEIQVTPLGQWDYIGHAGTPMQLRLATVEPYGPLVPWPALTDRTR
jgi:hypothetical protein